WGGGGEGYRRLIVGTDGARRQPPGTGSVDPFVEISLGGAAVAQRAYRDTGLTTELHRIDYADRVQHLRRDGDAQREILARSGESRPPLVSAPVNEQFLHGP